MREVVGILFHYTEGHEAYIKQDFATATKIFSEVARNSPTAISTPAISSFAIVMLQHFDPAYWDDLSNILHIYEREGYWRGRFYLTFCNLNPSNAADRIAELQAELAKDLPTEIRLTDQIVLADLLNRADHVLEADLLTRSIEEEVGDKVLAPDLRGYYIQICLNIASRLAGAGSPEAAERLTVYQKALGALNAQN
jgi:hypothetical protein